MVNKVVLMGRLTRDPELRKTQSDISVASFTLAVDRRTSGEEKTADFINIVAWRTSADFAAKYFSKGQLVAVVGRIQSRKWTDDAGQARTAVEVVADELHFAEPKRETASVAPVAVTVPEKRIPEDNQSSLGSAFHPVDEGDDELPF